MDNHDDDGGRLARDRAALLAALDAAAAGIDGEADVEAAYRQASWLTETLRQRTNASAETRSHLAARMRDAGGLSLAKLADRIGVSKARAAEMMQAAARKESR